MTRVGLSHAYMYIYIYTVYIYGIFRREITAYIPSYTVCINHYISRTG
jgi:hypothetical protein